MLGSMITLVLVVVGAVLVLCILIFGIYVTFYPMLRTLAGTWEIMKEQKETGQKEKITTEKEDELTPPEPD